MNIGLEMRKEQWVSEQTLKITKYRILHTAVQAYRCKYEFQFKSSKFFREKCVYYASDNGICHLFYIKMAHTVACHNRNILHFSSKSETIMLGGDVYNVESDATISLYSNIIRNGFVSDQ